MPCMLSMEPMRLYTPGYRRPIVTSLHGLQELCQGATKPWAALCFGGPAVQGFSFGLPLPAAPSPDVLKLSPADLGLPVQNGTPF